VAAVRILIVDDFGPWRQAVRGILQSSVEFEVVHEGSDGLEAVQKYKELQPDLVLLDVGLPKLNGLEAASQIRAISPEAKILFLSENHSYDVMREALRIGAAGYVVKSDAVNDLVPAMRAALLGEEFIRFKIAPDASTESC
jgi:DNA-binding NarL/FixJ family response regulator